MLATPSRVPEVAPSASVEVMIAMSTPMNNPQPSPRMVAARSTTGIVVASASRIRPPAVVSAPATANTRRRANRSETAPVRPAHTADNTRVITVTIRTEPATSSACTTSSRKKNR